MVPRAGDLPGRYLRRGEVIGYIEQPESHLVRVAVTQADIDLCTRDLRVSSKAAPAAGRELAGANSARGAGRFRRFYPARFLQIPAAVRLPLIPLIPIRPGQSSGHSNLKSSCRRVRHPAISAAGSTCVSRMNLNRWARDGTGAYGSSSWPTSMPRSPNGQTQTIRSGVRPLSRALRVESLEWSTVPWWKRARGLPSVSSEEQRRSPRVRPKLRRWAWKSRDPAMKACARRPRLCAARFFAIGSAATS